jgi:hypothetical protein
MAERLSTLQSLSSTTNLAHPTLTQPPPPSQPQSFPPRSVSFDIRSPEELAAVNEFLITLGRDITGQAVPRAAPDYSPAYFDAASLNQLGLAGMPGVPQVNAPGSGAGYHGEAGVYSASPVMMNHLPHAYPSRTAPIAQVQYGSGHMYPSIADLDQSVSGYSHRRVQSREHEGYPALHLSGPGQTMPTFFQPTPSHLLSPHSMESNASGGASPYSSHSTRSTPPINTPPHLAESLATFDSIMPSRAPPAIQLAPVDYHSHTRRHVVPLMTVPTRASVNTPMRSEPIPPKWNSRDSIRASPAKLADALASSSSLRSSSNSLYPLLTSGDAEFTLPPLQNQYRSRSPSLSSSPPDRPRSAAMSVDEDESDSSQRSTPTPPLPKLPPIHNALRTSGSERESERLAKQVGRIALGGHGSADSTEQQRKAHAAFLRDMLVSINREYRKRYGTPPPLATATSDMSAEVQMRGMTLTGPGVRGSMSPRPGRKVLRDESDVEMVTV